jgi:hypothetical protein
MAAHNYDGDMLTDEVAQVHRSPGFITSNLIGKRDDGVMIKEYEASHGTVADMWEAHLRGEETSLNPVSATHLRVIPALSHETPATARPRPASHVLLCAGADNDAGAGVCHMCSSVWSRPLSARCPTPSPCKARRARSRSSRRTSARSSTSAWSKARALATSAARRV